MQQPEPQFPRHSRSSKTGRFLTSSEAADYLGGNINSRTITRWAREGYLPAFPIGEGKRLMWRFVEEDLEAWMYARRRPGQMPAHNLETAYTGRSHRCSNPGE